MTDTTEDRARARFTEWYVSRYGYAPGGICPYCEDASISMEQPSADHKGIEVVCRHCGYNPGGILEDVRHELHCDDCGLYHWIEEDCPV